MVHEAELRMKVFSRLWAGIGVARSVVGAGRDRDPIADSN
jgi:hypothetical protein